jgi:hypothetical protein
MKMRSVIALSSRPGFLDKRSLRRRFSHGLNELLLLLEPPEFGDGLPQSVLALAHAEERRDAPLLLIRKRRDKRLQRLGAHGFRICDPRLYFSQARKMGVWPFHDARRFFEFASRSNSIRRRSNSEASWNSFLNHGEADRRAVAKSATFLYKSEKMRARDGW